jgi:hypothetical protein
MSMGSSPDRSRLYRKLMGYATTALIAWEMLGLGFSQIAKRRPVDKGPRALGIIQLAAHGNAHLIPIIIMLDGRFYDAAAYKADPVPLALQPETVYEGFKSGVSQGLFTVTGAGQVNGSWLAQGSWRSAADIEAEKAKREAASKRVVAPPPQEEIGGPPKLRRGSESKQQTPAPPPPPKPDSQNPTGKREPSPQPPSADSSAAIEDPNRPVLRRQPVSPTSHQQTKSSPEVQPLQGPKVDSIPAISDADGPEPRPYLYAMKPEEEQTFLKKMLALASDGVRSRAAQIAPDVAPRKSGSAVPPEFHDVSMRVFDLSNSNEATLVLTATARVPSPRGADLYFLTALVAREDIYGDLHKVFGQTTDNMHLDMLPKYELIDAVDVDGDGRGELLFRETWDSGNTYVVYRVIGDQLWPLFEGKPGS